MLCFKQKKMKEESVAVSDEKEQVIDRRWIWWWHHYRRHTRSWIGGFVSYLFTMAISRLMDLLWKKRKIILACAIHKFFALHFRRRRSHAPLLTPPLQILVLLLDLMLFLSSTTPIIPTFGPAHISSSKQKKYCYYKVSNASIIIDYYYSPRRQRLRQPLVWKLVLKILSDNISVFLSSFYSDAKTVSFLYLFSWKKKFAPI